MSKLLKALAAHDTGQRIAIHTPISWEVRHDVSNFTLSTEVVYDVRVTIGAKIICPPASAEEAKRRAWELINHEVYGEFREDLYLIRAALYARDVDKACAALAHLHDKMFLL